MTMPDRHDWVLGVGFALLGAVLGAAVLHQSTMLYFYQAFMPEMVYSACGHGFVRSPVTPRSMVDFLFGRTAVFDCATIGIAPEEPAGIFFRSQLYLAWTVSALWRVTSIRYSNLWPLVSTLVGAYACGCFVLVRLFSRDGRLRQGQLSWLCRRSCCRWFRIFGTSPRRRSSSGLSCF
ncbi:hypothetical protein ACTGJ9_018830 [Bradyrhizobium sp. RDM12]